MATPDSADPALTALYQARPDQFTALRAELVADAKERGDADAAQALAAARKPTTAAWVVNQLVHTDPSARDRLGDLSGRLRTAHAEMDGERIRALSAEQRLLVDHLTKAALSGAELPSPTGALR
ncbi:MAG: hypothetical protein WBB07_05985, partial [Mycobacterium sp.]